MIDLYLHKFWSDSAGNLSTILSLINIFAFTNLLKIPFDIHGSGHSIIINTINCSSSYKTDHQILNSHFPKRYLHISFGMIQRVT